MLFLWRERFIFQSDFYLCLVSWILMKSDLRGTTFLWNSQDWLKSKSEACLKPSPCCLHFSHVTVVWTLYWWTKVKARLFGFDFPEVSMKVLWDPHPAKPLMLQASTFAICLVLLFMCQNWSIWDGPGEGSCLLNKWTRFNSNLSADVHRTSIPWKCVLGSSATPVFPPRLAPLGAQISGLHHTAWDPPSNVCLHVTTFGNLKG